MSFTGIEFAFAFPLLVAAYWLLPRRAAAQNLFLLVASYLFYASWNWRFVPLLAGVTLADWLLTLAMERWRPAEGDDSSGAVAARRRMRGALVASVALNLALLGWFKYVGFFAESLNGVLGAMGIGGALPVLRLALPLGISFYTLQKLGYVFDVYHGRQPACRSLLTFATFVAFFPQLTAGPISRAGQLIPQLAAPRRLEPAAVASGVGTFLVGYVLKTFVADWVGPTLVDPVFAAPATFGVAAHWIALVSYAIQVFSDFAGYSLLAIGSARLLGVVLPVNFDYPFFSRSLPEFWRRWHITLNQWLFDYVYNPMVTASGWTRGRFDVGLVAVFLLSGLWHGATATFVLWGALHAVGMIVQRHYDVFYRGLCRKDRSWVQRRKGRGYAAAAWLVTQLFFVLTLVPFRAASFGGAAGFARGLVTSAGDAMPVLDGVPAYVSLFSVVIFLAGYHLAGHPATRRAWERFLALPAPVRGVAYGLAVVYLLLFLPVGASTFIYRQF